MRGRRR
jgi:hypothetical protein